jgi:hypothetical protein
MRRTYPTDLSDAEWARIKPHLPTPKAPGRPRVHSLREILNAIFYMGSAVAVLGACCRTSFRLGKLSTTTLELGALTVPGRSYTLPCAIAYDEYASREIPNLVRA